MNAYKQNMIMTSKHPMCRCVDETKQKKNKSLTIIDFLPYLPIFADRMMNKAKYKKIMSGVRLYGKLKKNVVGV